MTQLSYGPGVMYAERIDVTGSGIGPRQIGLLQDVSVTFSFSSKELYGQSQFPAAIARGQGKIAGKAKFAQINILVYSDLFFGLTSQAGQYGVAQDEPATIPAVSVFTVTVANNATYLNDEGVTYAATGRRFNRVTTPANAGEYTVNLATGVYTFFSADAGVPIKISYAYNIPTVGRKVTITNQAQGTTPSFTTLIYQKISPGCPTAGTQTLPLALKLNACVSNSLSFPLAQDAFMLQDFDFSGFADCSDVIGILSAVEQ